MLRETKLNSYNPDQTRLAINMLESNPITRTLHEAIQTTRASAMVQGIFQAGFRRHLPRLGFDSRVLDIGAGTGHIGQQLGEQIGLKLVSLDLVDLRTRENKTGDFVLADGYQLPFKDSSFDVVVMSDVLHFCRDQRSFLKEAYRVASEQGILILIEDEVDNQLTLDATDLMNRVLNFQLNSNPYFFNSSSGWNRLLLLEKFWRGGTKFTSWGPFNIFHSIYILGHKDIRNI